MSHSGYPLSRLVILTSNDNAQAHTTTTKLTKTLSPPLSDSSVESCLIHMKPNLTRAPPPFHSDLRWHPQHWTSRLTVQTPLPVIDYDDARAHFPATKLTQNCIQQVSWVPSPHEVSTLSHSTFLCPRSNYDLQVHRETHSPCSPFPCLTFQQVW